MSKEIVDIFKNVPKHVTRATGIPNILSAAISGMYTGNFFPELRYGGKEWSLLVKGEMYTSTDSTVKAVIVGVSPHMSKRQFPPYVPGQNNAPICTSIDGVVPDASIANPVSEACARCPDNVWGSKITDSGRKTKKCNDYKRVAIFIPQFPGVDGPIVALLGIPPGSFQNWREFIEKFQSADADPTVAVIRLGFKSGVQTPEITFTAMNWLTEAQIEKMKPIVEETDLDDLLVGSSNKPSMPVQVSIPAIEAATAIHRAVVPVPTNVPVASSEPPKRRGRPPKATQPEPPKKPLSVDAILEDEDEDEDEDENELDSDIDNFFN